jgi:hypothetical protein
MSEYLWRATDETCPMCRSADVRGIELSDKRRCLACGNIWEIPDSYGVERIRKTLGGDLVSGRDIFDSSEVEGLIALIDKLNLQMREVGSLLAVLHRDGGHYAAENGVVKACREGVRVINAVRYRIGMLEWEAEQVDRRLKT